jgi:PAS domain S-box-containing protein
MERILIVLDQESLRRDLETALRPAYEVIVGIPDEAAARLQRPAFDLAILDGASLDRHHAAITALKERTRPEVLPFLAVAPRSGVNQVERHLGAAADELLLVPFEPVELKTRVESLLRVRRRVRERGGLPSRRSEALVHGASFSAPGEPGSSAQAADDRRLQDHAWYLENLDRVSRLLAHSRDTSELLQELARILLDVFQADRAWLLYPFDPAAASCRVPVEAHRPEYPGAFEQGAEVPIDDRDRDFMRQVLANEGTVAVDFTAMPERPGFAERHDIKSQMLVILRPRFDRPWALGVHQCSHARAWSELEQRLFRAIGQRTGEVLDLHLMHQEVRHSERRFRSLIENVSDAISLLARDGTILYTSPGTRRVLGYDPSALVGAKGFDFLHPDSRAAAHAAIEQCLRTPGSPVEVRGRMLHASGSSRFFEGVVMSLLDDSSVAAIVLNFRDVTARHQVQKDLLASQERLRLALEAANQGLYDLDVQTGDAIISPEYARMLGYEPEELKETNALWRERLHPDDRAAVYQVYEDYIAGRRSEYRIEFRQRMKSGDWKWILSLGKVVAWDERGRPLRMLGTHTDITERKRAEEALRQSERKMRALLASVDDIIFELDGLGTFLDVWTRDESHLAVPKDEIRGRRMSQVLGEAFSAPYLKAIQEVLHTLRTQEIQYLLPVRGVPRWFLARINPVIAEDGSCHSVSMLVRNVTERKQADEALSQSEQRLRSIIVNLPIVLFAIDSNGVFTLSEGKGLSALGLRPGEAVGISALEMYSGHPSVIEPLRRALSGEPLEAIVEVGPTRFNVFYTPLKDDQGQMSEVLGVAVDVTERARAEEALQESEEKYRSLVESAQDPIFVSDADGRYLYVNSAAAAQFGTIPEKIVGKSVDELFPPHVAERLRACVKQVIQTGQGLITEEMSEINGKPLWFSTNLQPIRDPRGQVKAVQAVARDISSLKQAEQALRESEERLRQAVRVSNIGIFDHDHRTDTIYWSPRQREIHGWGPDEPITLPMFFDLLHPEDRESITAAVRRAHDPAGDGVWDVEHRIIRRDGTVRWLTARSQTFFEGEGAARRPVRTVGGVRDITDRVRVDERQKGLVEILENSLNEIYIFDAETLHFVEANRGARENSGYVLEELRSLTPLDLTPSYTLESFEELILPLRTGERHQIQFTTEHRRKYGSRYPVEAHLQLSSLEGRPVFVSMILDITQRKRTEEALRASEANFRRIVETAQEGIWQIDTEGRTTFANQRMAELLGCPPDQLIGRKLFDFVDEEGRAITLDDMKRRRQGIAEQHDFKFLRADGSALWAMLTTNPVHDESGNLLGALAMVADITERRRAEEEIRRLNAELEERVRHRTAELEAANQELKSANEELEGFSYSVSHDLRAPLRTIDGFCAILREEYEQQLPEPARRHLDRISKGARQMGRLVDDLLSLARISRQPLRRQSVRPVEIVRRCLEELSGQQRGRRVEIEVAGLPPCQAEPTLLHQAWLNLLDNALKYTARREVARIEVGWTPVPPPESGGSGAPAQTAYFVRDNGVGFDMQYAGLLFGVFQRLHGSSEYEGTGVGLAIVKRIVERHGGRVWAEAAPDRGAAFFFTLGGG